MNNRPDDKMQGGNADPGREKLLEDLDEILPEEQAQQDDSAFDKDSTEGLAQINPEKAPQIIKNLNRDLHRRLTRTKKKNPLPGFSFINITVITVIILIIIAWLVIRKINS